MIVNQSNHRILAYTLLFNHGNGRLNPWRYSMLGQLRKQPMASVGIAPGSTFLHPQPVQARDAKGQVYTAGAIAVELDSVLFDDGSFVGPDKAGNFDRLTARIQAEKNVHAILVAANGAASAWSVVEAVASGQTVPPTEQARSKPYQDHYRTMCKTFAEELLNVRSNAGNATALSLAGSSAFYPTIVKGE